MPPPQKVSVGSTRIAEEVGRTEHIPSVSHRPPDALPRRLDRLQELRTGHLVRAYDLREARKKFPLQCLLGFFWRFGLR